MHRILVIPVIFSVASIILYVMSMNAPRLDNGLNEYLKFPTNLDELRSVVALLEQYRTDHMGYVLLLFSTAYLYKQTFAIPGSVMLNLVAGALFGVWFGFPLVCVLTAFGATFCYSLSKYFGREYIMKHFPDKLQLIQKKIDENRQSLFFFLLFLRLFPMSPNWLLNIVSPILNVPLIQFFLSVLLGLIPYNFICVQTGEILAELHSLEDIFSFSTLFQLFLIAFVALLPGYLIRKCKAQFIAIE